MGVFSPDHHTDAADQNTGADSYDHHTQRFGVSKRPDCQPFKGNADHGGKKNGQNNRRNQGKMEKRQKKNSKHPAQHDKFTLSKVDDSGSVMNDGEAKTNQRINSAVGKAG